MSDQQLPPFGFPQPCPKCGHGTFPPRLEYRPAVKEHIADVVVSYPESVRQSCHSCGYSILTAPLDATP